MLSKNAMEKALELILALSPLCGSQLKTDFIIFTV